jgi:indole-3-pyruvate monooxygenase
MDFMISNIPAIQEAVEAGTIIIGAGPAGLAIGACLRRAEIPFLILEQSDRVAPAWHRHYDRLHLHTDKAHSALPFLPLPREYPRYPARLQVIDYLEGYARHFQLEPRFSQQVTAARRVKDRWEVKTQDRVYQAENLVIATGYNRVAYIPSWPSANAYRGGLLHSSQYKNGAPFKNQKVLVVCFGNSGGEIAIDLWEHGAQAALAVRSPVNVIPRELFGIPILTIGIAQSKLPPRLADSTDCSAFPGGIPVGVPCTIIDRTIHISRAGMPSTGSGFGAARFARRSHSAKNSTAIEATMIIDARVTTRGSRLGKRSCEYR